MKTKTLALFLCLIGFASTVHANTDAVAQGYLIDDGSSVNDIAGLRIILEDDGVPTALSEEDQLTMQLAANDASVPDGCRTMHGKASVYSKPQKLADGTWLKTGAMAAAMLPGVPLGKTVQVTRGGKTISVKINDRGPYVRGRIIDLTPAAAGALGFSERGAGVVPVSVLVCK